MTDPTIDRIRKVRHQVSKQCSHDAKKLIDHYKKLQEKYADRMVQKRTINK